MTRFRRMALYAALVAVGLFSLAFLSPPAGASESLGGRVLDMAETQSGCWYAYGHTGPCGSGYDCSGLVYWAAQRLGITLPRTTYGMLAGSAHLYRIPLSQAQRGDLMFYGSGHVEFNTIWYHMTFGAQQTGTRVGWHGWNGYWQPTMAMRIR